MPNVFVCLRSTVLTGPIRGINKNTFKDFARINSNFSKDPNLPTCYGRTNTEANSPFALNEMVVSRFIASQEYGFSLSLAITVGVSQL